MARVKAKPLIAIVDDDESVREAIEALMKSVDYRAQVFASAADFLASPTIKKAACLIADINMPQMTGIELHRTLVARGNHVPTILITGYPDDQTRARVLADGVICYLGKPFDDEVLLGCVREALSKPAR